MENLTLEELNTLESWYVCLTREYSTEPSDESLIIKVRQAITDKEFEEKRLNF